MERNYMQEYAFSTSWNVRKHPVGRDMMEEIIALGFNQIELNYQVSREHLNTIEPMIESGKIKISSVHHVFPKEDNPKYGPDSLMLGSHIEEDRLHGIDLLIQSAEYAHRYGAKAVVLHPGEADIPARYDAELKRMYQEGKRDSETYTVVFREMLHQRTMFGAEAINRMEASLAQVFERLAKRGIHVAIGLETRARCHQIPTPGEAADLIDRLQGAPLYFWLDTGHALMMERMGLYDNAVDLAAFSKHIYGMHIHDTVGLSDHWAPYVHTEDLAAFERFVPAIAEAPLKVFELKPAVTPEEIVLSVKRLHERIEAVRRAKAG